MGFRIYKQNQKIESLDKAELSDKTEITTEEFVSGENKVVITKTSSGLSQEGDVEIDTENTYLRFTGFGPGKEHVGTFDSMKSEIYFNEGAVSSGNIIIETSSVNTGIDNLDSHLKTGDFLESETYPQIKFNLNNVVVSDEDQSAVANGEVEIKGITKNISIPLTLLANGFSVDFLLDMEQFEISYTGVNKEVQIEAQVIWK
jgi:polyisoprenoid-binding protein YceI